MQTKFKYLPKSTLVKVNYKYKLDAVFFVKHGRDPVDNSFFE